MKSNLKNLIFTLGILAGIQTQTQPLHAQGTAFTYQGRLNSGGAITSGMYDLTFTVYGTNVTGVPLAGPVAVSGVSVTNGLFTVTLDPGLLVFTGPDRWLEIAVRTNTAILYTTLSPRQHVTATPYAIFAGSASNLVGALPASQITGTIGPANIAPGSITSVMLAPGAVSMLGAPDGSPTNAVQVNNNGLVGVGTSTPTAGLQIATGGTSTTLPVLFEVQNGAKGWTNLEEVNCSAANGGLLALGSVGGVTLASITNPSAPALLSQIIKGTGAFTNLSYITEMAWAGSNLVASAWGAFAGDVRAINIISCTNPASPVKLTELRNGVNGWNHLGAVTGLAVSGNLLAIGAEDTTDGNDAVTLADLSNPAAPVQKSFFEDTVGYTNLYGINCLSMSGNLLAIGAIYGVTLVDVSNPSSPVKLAELRDGAGGNTNLSDIFSLSLSGNLLAVASAGSSAVTLMNVSSPANPAILAVLRDGVNGYSLAGSISVALSGNRLVIGSGNPGTVMLVDVSNPASPVLMATARNGLAGADYLTYPSVSLAGSNVVACGAGANFFNYGVTILGVANPTVSLASAGWVGIGTTNPAAALDVVGNVLVENAALFDVSATRVALGVGATASGNNSAALGAGSVASGDNSTAMGLQTVASGQYSTAMGNYTTASGGTSTAMGIVTTASGGGSTAMGAWTIASGDISTAMGFFTTASGTFSTAMGNLATAAHDNTFVWADGSVTNGFSTTTSNQFLICATNGVGINTNVTAGAALTVSGNAIVTGLLRSGSETGTSQPPSPAGLVVRRVNGTIAAAGQIVARTDNLTLERDNTYGGFLIRYPASPGRITIACMGINNSGVNVNFFTQLTNPPAAGTVQVYSDAQNVVHFECSFGVTYDAGQHLTQVTLSRWGLDNYWSGTLMSTYNQ